MDGAAPLDRGSAWRQVARMTDIARAVLTVAATLILVRDGQDGPRVLMGQRGSAASFMPSKFVFPGGALDADDIELARGFSVAADCDRRLRDAES